MGVGTVTANGIELWYEDFGEITDPHVVLIMGANATALVWDASFYEPIVDAGYHVVRFDNRDEGLSQWFDAAHPYTLDDMAADTIGLMDALSIDRAHLVGVSMGGMIGQVVALRYPERVLTLTSICSSPGASDGRLPSPPPAIIELMMAPFPDTRAEQVEWHLAGYRAMAGSWPFADAHHRARFEADLDRGFNPSPGHGMAVYASGSRLETLADLDLPVLVIHGDADPLLPFEHGAATADAIPGARLLVLPGAGHIDVLDQPDLVLPSILEMFSRPTR
jgi:pimeloyl-ACP methyl ester carboxylesterase